MRGSEDFEELLTTVIPILLFGLVFSLLAFLGSSIFFESMSGRSRTSSEQASLGSNTYVVARNVGSAGYLRERCLILHFFCDLGGADGDWKIKDLYIAKDSINQVNRWIGLRASESGPPKEIEFIEKAMLLKDRPTATLAHMDKSRHDLFWKIRVLTTLGFPFDSSPIEELKTEYQVQNVAFVLHFSTRGRGYAKRVEDHGFSNETSLEIANVYVNTKRRYPWPKYSTEYAHELFHLFGADDLYNLHGAKSYYPEDIMHGELIPEAVVSPLTAYAIGWSDAVPKIHSFSLAGAQKIYENRLGE